MQPRLAAGGTIMEVEDGAAAGPFEQEREDAVHQATQPARIIRRKRHSGRCSP
jgi:hypothetical protein